MNHESLTPDSRRVINEFVASKMGWRPPDHPDTATRTQGYCMPEKWWMDPTGELQFRHNIPDLFASLDACHEAEKVLITDWFLSIGYQSILSKMNIIERDTEKPELSCPIFAPASQRAVGLFQTLGGVL